MKILKKSLISLVNESFLLFQDAIDLFCEHPILKNLSNQIQNEPKVKFNLHSNVYINQASGNKYQVYKDDIFK